MADNYVPHTWIRGETIAATLLNHMEQGIQAAQEAANKAQDAQEMRAAFDMLANQTRAAIRDLDKRLSALENQ
jgi:hypothetical protein